MNHSAQSPVHISAALQPREPLLLSYHWQLSQGVPVQTDHGLKLEFPLSERNYAQLGDQRFLLRNIHFHRPSEHILLSHQFNGEVHIVCQDLDSLAYLVLGIFLEVSETVGAMPATWSEQFKDLHPRGEKVHCLPGDWIPRNASHIYRYEGSLTTPPYSETVSWAVFDAPKRLTKRQYAILFGDSKPHARALQPLHRRFILKYPWQAPED